MKTELSWSEPLSCAPELTMGERADAARGALADGQRVRAKFYAMGFLVRAGFDKRDLLPLDSDRLVAMVEEELS